MAAIGGCCRGWRAPGPAAVQADRHRAAEFISSTWPWHLKSRRLPPFGIRWSSVSRACCPS